MCFVEAIDLMPCLTWSECITLRASLSLQERSDFFKASRANLTFAIQLLSEAIIAARTSGDRITLHHCTRYVNDDKNSALINTMFSSLLHRLPTENPGQKPILHAVQPDIHPLEVLFDVSKLLEEENVGTFSSLFYFINSHPHLRISLSVLHLTKSSKLWACSTTGWMSNLPCHLRTSNGHRIVCNQ